MIYPFFLGDFDSLQNVSPCGFNFDPTAGPMTINWLIVATKKLAELVPILLSQYKCWLLWPSMTHRCQVLNSSSLLEVVKPTHSAKTLEPSSRTSIDLQACRFLIQMWILTLQQIDLLKLLTFHCTTSSSVGNNESVTHISHCNCRLTVRKRVPRYPWSRCWWNHLFWLWSLWLFLLQLFSCNELVLLFL